MKKLILIVGLLLLISISLSADDIMRPEEITLEQFANEYIPDYTLKKRIPLECREVGAFAVAKDTGNIVAITQELIADTHKLQTVVNYFDIDGNLLWKKSIEGIYSITCAITDNGELITAYGHFDKHSCNSKSIVLSNKGDILCTKVFDRAGVVPSPDGKYLYLNRGESDSKEAKGFKLFDKNFEQVNVTGFDFNNLNNIHFTFVSDNNILMYAYDTINSLPCYYLLQINQDNNITLLWKYEIEKPYKNYPSYFYDDVKVHKDKMIINTLYSPVYVFNFVGDLLYKDNEIHFNFVDFIDSNTVFLMRPALNSKTINLETKEIDEKSAPYRGGGAVLKDIYCEGQYLLFSLKDILNIINNNNWNHRERLLYSLDKITKNSKEYYIFVKFGFSGNPEIVIYERSSK